MDNNLINTLVSIENRYSPIIEILERKSEYSQLYKGFMTFQSEVNPNPDILFLGINPGNGAFNEKNNFSNEIIFPKRLISDANYLDDLKLDWLKKGVSRGEFIKKKWHAYDWFKNEEKINNSFPARMIELLILYTEKLHAEKNLSRKDIIDVIENKIQSKVVYSNIYPIATESTKQLNEIINKLSKEKDIEKIIGINVKATPSNIKNFFRQRTIDFINELNPKTIVLLGHTAYKDLTLFNDYKGHKMIKKIIQLRKNDQKKYKIISFSRQGNWSTLIENIATAIIED